MALNSVNPGSFNQGPMSQANNNNQQQNPDVSSGQFSVNNPQIGTAPLPQSNPIFQNANSVSTDILANATKGMGGSQQQAQDNTGSQIGKSVGAIGGTIIGGPVGGAIGSALGGIFGDLFAGGGMVSEGNSNQDALTLGYLVGALHQRDFNGSPDSLSQAADMIKQKMGNREQSMEQPQGLAAGGEVNADAELAQQALMQALGLNTQTQSSPQAQPNPPQQQIQPQPEEVPQTIQPNPMQQEQQPQGYAQRLAMGGPSQEQPPLQPGQTFQGDGSVKGPGTATSDSIPAKLSDGEFVFAVPAVQFFGVDKLVKMNEQGKQGFMEALGQVQANQTQGPTAAMPQGQAQAPMMPQSNSMPPQGQPAMRAGGFAQGQMQNKASSANTKNGYCGL